MIRSAIVLTMALIFLNVPAAFAASLPVRLLNVVTSRQGYAIQSDLAYGELPRQKLDLYVPDHTSATTPVVVFFYGGGWNRGERADYLFVGQSLASAGFIVAIPDYRLYPEAVFPEFMRDGAKAIAFIRNHLSRDGRDAHPLFLAGHSAGAHIAALLNLDERYLRKAGVARGAIAGAVGLSGPYDFLPLHQDIYKAIFPEPVRAESQPIAFVDGTEAPMLLITGEADRTVDPDNTRRLAREIANKGGSVVVKTYPGVGHIGTVAALATATPWSKPDVRAQIIGFVQYHTAASKR